MSTATLTRPATTTKTAKPLTATVDRADLLDALRFVEAAINKRAILPILAGVRLDGRRGKLIVSGYDYERSAEQSILAPGAAGSVLVKASHLRQLITVMPKDASIVLTATAQKLQIDGGPVTYSMPTLPVEEFPAVPIPGADTHTILDITGEQFTSLGWPLAAAGRDDTLPVLTGVYLITDPDTGQIELACTDRYRLAVHTTDLTVADTSAIDAAHSLLIPGRFLTTAIRAFTKARRVIVNIDGDTIWVGDGNRSLSAKLLDGQFPKYRSLIPNPSDATTSVTADAATMRIAVAQAAAGAGRTTPVRLHLDGTGKIALRVGDDRLDTTTAVVAVPDAQQVGNMVDVIAFNPSYLLDCYRLFPDGTNVTLHLTTAGKPGVFTSPTRPGFSYLLMPVRLAD